MTGTRSHPPLKAGQGLKPPRPDSHPSDFCKFNFCCSFLWKQVWWLARDYEQSPPHLFHSVPWNLFSTRNFASFPFAFSTVNTGDCKIIVHFLPWKQSVLGTTWFTFLMRFCLEVKSWDSLQSPRCRGRTSAGWHTEARLLWPSGRKAFSWAL